MTATVKSYIRTITIWAWEDIQPFDGRFAMTWRVAALCAIATAVFMTYGIPLAAIGCYLILYLMKPDGAESAIMAGGLGVLIGLAILALIFLAQWTVDAPWLRLVIILVGSFIFIYLGAASQIGPEANILALVVGFAMTLIGDVPNGEIATRAILYAGLMAATPMALIIAFSLFLGRSPLRLLRQQLHERLEAAAQAFESSTALGSARTMTHEGNSTLDKWALFCQLLHLCPSTEAKFLRSAIDDSYRVLMAVLALPPNTPQATRQVLAAACRAAADRIVQGHNSNTPTDASPNSDETTNNTEGPDPLAALSSAELGSVAAVTDALKRLQRGQAGPAREKQHQAFFYPDALSNPVYQHFAIKTTAAATISYLAYTAIDWQGIHTAMITCYVAALGTTAETLHKLVLRIVGCLIGAAMGVASILFLIPYMTSVGSLMLLVFVAILIAGWVSSGPERIAYAGIQIGLAFLLTVIQGFGPDLHLSAASDRIMGILLGNLVTYLVFTRLWPLSVADVARQQLNQTLQTLNTLIEKFQNQQPDFAGLARSSEALNHTKEQLELSVFEPRRLRPGDDTIGQLQELAENIQDVLPEIAYPSSQTQRQATSHYLKQAHAQLNTDSPNSDSSNLTPAQNHDATP
ncbi:MAG TPA: FUSC family protein [Burkholderiaceae bacterium]|nr:FUSC family protein [Burkholderiaceae bacterium]